MSYSIFLSTIYFLQSKQKKKQAKQRIKSRYERARGPGHTCLPLPRPLCLARLGYGGVPQVVFSHRQIDRVLARSSARAVVHMLHLPLPAS